MSHDAEPLANLAAGQLSEPEARTVEAHIATCAGCAETFESFREAVDAVRENIMPEQFMTDTGDSSDLLFQGRILGEIRRRKQAESRRTRWHWAAAAAVAVVVALGGGVAVATRRLPRGARNSSVGWPVAARYPVRAGGRTMLESADTSRPM